MMATCIPFCANEVDGLGNGSCDVLVVGLEGSGKSLLCRRLQSLYHKDGTAHYSAYTVTTNGIQLTEVACSALSGSSKLPVRSVMMREVGGQMCPLWPQYYDDCHMAVFVVDATDPASIAPAAVELCEMMVHPKMQNKPVCVVLSKQDQALVLSRQEVELVMHLTDLERVHEPGFCVFELSSIPGVVRPDGGQVLNSMESLLEWMVDCKCGALGLAVPNRGAGLSNQTAGLFVPKWDVTAQMS